MPPPAEASLRKSSFAPYLPPVATRLLLGSLPGDRSLARGQYYAHPRNAFWPLMAALAGCALPEPYGERLALLDRLGVALWDVCASAQRIGSLDARIQAPIVNDIGALLVQQPQISVVAFNGTAAAHLFRRWVAPALPLTLLRRCRVAVLPSSSAAAARLTVTQKLTAWDAVLSDR